MKHSLFLFIVVAGACLNGSCIKSTSSAQYDSVWKPYTGTVWTQPAGISNFATSDGGFQFDAVISQLNRVDSLGVKVAFIPAMYQVTDIETGSGANLTVFAGIVSIPDSMQLQVPQINPATHDTVRYIHFQFGRVTGSIRTAGKDSVLSAPRAFAPDTLYSYSPSIHPDSCSREMYLQFTVNWNTFTGPAVVNPLTSTKVTIQVKNLSLTVTGVDILK